MNFYCNGLSANISDENRTIMNCINMIFSDDSLHGKYSHKHDVFIKESDTFK